MFKVTKFLMIVVLMLGIQTLMNSQTMGDPFLVKSGGENINCQPPNSAPLCVDFDSDGLQDLIIGTLRGEFRFYKNCGTNTNPVFNGFTLLQANEKDAKIHNW